MNKRGQFFLIAAFLLAGMLFSVTSAANSARVGNANKPFYDLSREVGFETKRVLDYGVYYERDTPALVQGFLLNYSNYIAEEQVLFIFGNRNSLNGLYFTNSTGTIGIGTGGVPGTIPIQQLVSNTIANVDVRGHMVTVTIDGIPYEFVLRDGQNFFFVMRKGEHGERFVATGR